MPQIYAVFTGDLVESTTLSSKQIEEVFVRLSGMAEQIGAWPGGVDARFERSRGDGWQMLAPGDGRALRAALLMRAVSLSAGVDTRVSIGIGAIEALSLDSLAASDGTAFHHSGRGLENLKKMRRVGLFADGLPELATTVVELCDALVSTWTERQAEVMALSLQPDGPTQTEISDILSVGQSTVFKHFRAASGPALETALDDFETALEGGE